MKQTKPAQAMELRSLSPVFGGRLGGRAWNEPAFREYTVELAGRGKMDCSVKTLCGPMVMGLVVWSSWSQAQTGATPKTAGIAAEAQKQADTHFAELVARCPVSGDSYFYYDRGITDYGETITEMRSPKVSLVAREIGEAEKLNGLEWHGDAHPDAKASRRYRHGKWSEWSPKGSLPFFLEKKNGKWTFGRPLNAIGGELRKPDCATLPAR